MQEAHHSPSDVIVIGAGLAGLSVLVLERNDMPGGACGAFRRRGVTFDRGAAMLFGFGERGMAEYRCRPGQENLVTVVDGPLPRRPEPVEAPATAAPCQWCEDHFCRNSCPASLDMLGILRRIEVGNPGGARSPSA